MPIKPEKLQAAAAPTDGTPPKPQGVTVFLEAGAAVAGSLTYPTVDSWKVNASGGLELSVGTTLVAVIAPGRWVEVHQAGRATP